MSAVKAALSEAQRAQLTKGTGAAMNAHSLSPENSWFQRQTLPKKFIPTRQNTELLMMVEDPVVMGIGAVIAVVNERCSSVRERCNECISAVLKWVSAVTAVLACLDIE